MLIIRNKRLMNKDDMDYYLPSVNDFTFFGGGGKGGGGHTVVYVPQKETIEKVKQAPKPEEQMSSETEITGDIDTSSDMVGRKRTLGGTRRLAIPVTTSR